MGLEVFLDIRSAHVLRRSLPPLDWEAIRVGTGTQSRVISYPRAESNALTIWNAESLQDACSPEQMQTAGDIPNESQTDSTPK